MEFGQKSVCPSQIHSYERSMNWRKYKAIIIIARYLIKMMKKSEYSIQATIN